MTSGRVGAGVCALGFALLLAGGLAGGGAVSVPWAPAFGLRLSFALDGLALMYGLLATGIGAVVLVYSARYMPAHLAREGRPPREGARFHAWMVLFAASMVGLVTAQDLVLAFVFWDLTAVASYFLIATDRHRPDARRSALMALIVTAGASLPFLAGILILRAEYGTVQIPQLVERAQPGTALTTAGALIVVAALAKSAQVPLHFWLPRAMAAPTPVSAYLHSAAMVAAGVFLLGRLYPLIVPSAALLDALLWVGMASILTGAVLALASDSLKHLLAYSTVAQYGYVVALLGVGGAEAVGAACFYVIAHALTKCALFLAAGAATEATGGRTRLSEIGGLWRRLPLLAAGTGVAAAGLAALPLTIGFFKDELFFAALVAQGPLLTALAVLAAGLTLAYLWRFWAGIFLGAPRVTPEPVPRALVWPVAALGVLTLVGGAMGWPFELLAREAAEATLRAPVDLSAAYHLDARAENLMALGAYALGALLVLGRPLWTSAVAGAADLGARLGPERGYRAGLGGLNRLSCALHDLEARDLRDRIAAVLVPASVLVGIALIAAQSRDYRVGDIARADVWLAVAVGVAALAALALTRQRHHLTLVLALASVGFALAVTYATFAAPDVAMVALLVEILVTVLFLTMLARVPPELLRAEAATRARGSRRWRDPLVGVIAGGLVFAVVWGALSRPPAGEGVAEAQIDLADEAHATDTVTAILSDFRALDTLVEISVVGVALVGIATLLRSARERVR